MRTDLHYDEKEICTSKTLESDRSVGIATGYGLDDLGFISVSVRFFPSPQFPYRHSGPHSLLYNGYRELYPREKGPGHEVDHTPIQTGEVKKDGAIPPLPNMFSWHNV
jgi:hypothetical protein